MFLYLPTEFENKKLKTKALAAYSAFRSTPELNPSLYGLTDGERYDLHGILYAGAQEASLSELQTIVSEMYCGPLSVEFQHLQV